MGGSGVGGTKGLMGQEGLSYYNILKKTSAASSHLIILIFLKLFFIKKIKIIRFSFFLFLFLN
jgi:hypothetical protein